MNIKLFFCASLFILSCNTTKPTSDIIIKQDFIINSNNEFGKDSLIIDTLAYIKSAFIEKKEKYINKQLSVLLNDLKIQVKSYKTGIAANNRNIVPNISLSFYSSGESSYREAVSTVKPNIIWVTWKKPLPADSVSAILINKNINKREWGEPEKNYYGKQIVKDFGIIDFKK